MMASKNRTAWVFYLFISFSSVYGYGQSLPRFRVHADSLRGINEYDLKKMNAAMSLFEEVMNDTSFQNALLAKTFYFDVAGDQNKLLTTKEIVEKIFAAKEFYRDGADAVANLFWIIEKKNKPIFTRNPAIGYGDAGEVEIYTYTWFFIQEDRDNLAAIAGHIAHEWSHKLGFQHLFNPHKKRKYTVPYAFGYLVEEYALKKLAL